MYLAKESMSGWAASEAVAHSEANWEEVSQDVEDGAIVVRILISAAEAARLTGCESGSGIHVARVAKRADVRTVVVFISALDCT